MSISPFTAATKVSCRFSSVALLVLSTLTMDSVAGTLEQAKRMHDRLAGVPPSEAVLLAMKADLDAQNGMAAAWKAMANDAFYEVTLKNWAAPWTNREQSVFVPLNDYIATVIGMVRDELDFRQLLYGDILYTGNGVAPAYSNSNNAHYLALENGGYRLQEVLRQQVQSEVTGLASAATAGVLTSRAAAKAFFIAGTNRAQLRFTLMNHLCRDLEELQDTSLSPDRIRQDVSRSPGGDARAFLNGCLGCHSGMDPLAQAFAYYNYDYDANSDLTGERGRLVYNAEGVFDAQTGSRVQAKYHINGATFPYGYVTPDDRWDNYWRTGINAALSWDDSLPGRGEGAKSLGAELAHSGAFAQCHVSKIFKTVCLREPGNSADRAQIEFMLQSLTDGGYNIKTTFAQAADYCKGD